MNKTEKIKHLTKSVIAFMEALDYQIVNDESGRLLFSVDDGYKDIEYSRSGDVCVDNWANDETKLDADKLEKFVKIIKQSLAL